MFLEKIVPRRWCHFSVIWKKDFKTFDIRNYFFIGRTPTFNQVRSDIIVSVGKLVISLGYFLWQVKVKVVTKVNVEDVELSVVDKEQNIKSKTLR